MVDLFGFVLLERLLDFGHSDLSGGFSLFGFGPDVSRVSFFWV
jgi:hypothetical protein